MFQPAPQFDGLAPCARVGLELRDEVLGFVLEGQGRKELLQREVRELIADTPIQRYQQAAAFDDFIQDGLGMGFRKVEGGQRFFNFGHDVGERGAAPVLQLRARTLLVIQS